MDFDVDQFNGTLKYLNEAGNFEEAKTYIIDKLIQKFDWLNESKASIAKDFIKLCRRRYL